MTATPRPGRRFAAAALTGAMIPAFAATGAFAEPASDEIDLLLEEKVDEVLLEEIEQSGETELWLRFDGAPDYSEAAAAEDKEDKGEAAVEAAVEYAEAVQADVVAALDAAGAEYETFWGSSTVKVVGDADLLAEIVAFDEVQAVVEAPQYAPIAPIAPDGKTVPGIPWAERAGAAQDGPEWGLEHVRAPEVWADGFDGEGIVVANLDTGVQFDHPALVDQYRGNNGDGTFNHDYNFFDVIGECDGEPCDVDGHGTHTMGTMVGDDGEGNQIGVAPGAKWIAVTAGDWSLESLLTAGEWIAAPTDSEGYNPDPAMAPHVVNNSWGTLAGYDLFYADIIDLWHAAGIIPVFAAGNTGELGCLTTGSPGVYENVIAVGATDIDRLVTEWSSKGPGMDGYIKPDVVAPGDEVRSALPGDDYGNGSGTSMAAPHVAGTVALMMSKAPKLEGNYKGVYKHLTGNAVKFDDRSCRGKDKANNVYGYGHTDAFASVKASPAGKFGSLSGLATDTEATALSGVRIVFEGPVNRVVLTGPGGSYDFSRIPVGDYKVTASKFLYETTTGTVTIKRGKSAVFDVALAPLPAQTVEGVVVDGSGHGWPLAAKVRTAGNEASAVTDPLTGEFSLRIPQDGDWPLTVAARYRGYETAVVDPADAERVELPISDGCTAPGYGSETLQEDFETFELPEGWTVESRGDETWTFDYPADYNLTPSDGGFAIADSDFADPDAHVATDLISPVFDLSAADDPSLKFASFFVDSGIGAEASVSISTDGGETWEQIWHTDEDLLDTVESIDLSDWADATEARVKFTYDDNDTWAWFWEVDAVKVGCDVLEGGLVTGTVVDADTGQPVRGALVSDPATGAAASTDRDGRYVLFTDAGAASLEVSADGYGSAEADVEVIADAVVGADVALTAEEDDDE